MFWCILMYTTLCFGTYWYTIPCVLVHFSVYYPMFWCILMHTTLYFSAYWYTILYVLVHFGAHYTLYISAS